jgi:hypothetical protein
MESNGVEDLSVIAEARAAIADRLVTPWWYHPALGLLMAGYVLALGLGDTVVKIASGILVVVGGAALARAYRRLTGVWVSGFDAGPASRWAAALGGLAGLAGVTAWGLGASTDLRWPVWCLALVMVAASVVLGRRFDTALRAQLRAGT